MSYTTFDLTVEDHIAHLQLNRPDAYNSMNQAFWRELPAAIRAIDEAAEARVIVISSSGKHFSAGMDLEVFSNPNPTLFQGERGRQAEGMRRLVMQLQACFNVLEEVRMPVLTAIQGGCIGGAVDMVCAADMRYCTEDAFFQVKETELGMSADLGTLQRLPQLIAPGLARELAYTARKMAANEAASSGFVNRVFADQETMLTEVLAIARQIAERSPLAVTGTKQMINYARDHSMADSLTMMATWQAGMFQPTDMVQTFSAKMTQQTPDYEGLRPVTEPLK
ncbi:crotonase/enoyl-CoA hydratase family protein [Pontibacterium granulatum]|uniref:crotonase/enoyl-CoA hydratase family protein n=1 Tax=Pontibacterium granulatum TaxID=2036029 RepID=UPI00249AA8D8|nr:crotonase/enoyl-CoA hydratase family protein [Pontibacterium granulatum]MDI3323463.1 crotonase/enoyl-CoA hydratase family protein [Pontibacterium granulatum]